MTDYAPHIGAVIYFAVMLVFLIAIPFIVLWSLNTLGIANASYGVIEWIASAVLTAVLLGGSE